MINFWVAVRNPFKCADFKNIWNCGGLLSKNKGWEVQLSKYAYNCLEFKIDLNWRGSDHAGPWLTLNVFGYTVDARIYDCRHWNDKSNNWAIYS
jgi:hypothetical protein